MARHGPRLSRALRGRPRRAPPAARPEPLAPPLLALLRRAKPGLDGAPSSTIATRCAARGDVRGAHATAGPALAGRHQAGSAWVSGRDEGALRHAPKATCTHAPAHDPRGPPPHHLASKTDPMTTETETRPPDAGSGSSHADHEVEWEVERHVYEPHRVGLPPI